jgi:hypothetical protein
MNSSFPLTLRLLSPHMRYNLASKFICL